MLINTSFTVDAAETTVRGECLRAAETAVRRECLTVFTSQVKVKVHTPLFLMIPAAFSLLSNIRCFKIDQPSAGDASGAPAVWSHGYTEASGVKNKYVEQNLEPKMPVSASFLGQETWWHTSFSTVEFLSVCFSRIEIPSSMFKHQAGYLLCITYSPFVKDVDRI